MRKTLSRIAAIAGLAVFALAGTASAASTTIEGETMSGGSAFSDSNASGGRALLLQPPASATKTVTTVAAAQLLVVARGDQCNGAPLMRVQVDGADVGTVSVPSKSWAPYSFQTAVLAGSHSITVSFINDYKGGGCNRALRVDYVRASSIDTAATNPLTGASLFVNPSSSAVGTENWLISQNLLADGDQMHKISSRPQAKWFGDFSGDVRTAVDAHVTAAAALGQVPTLVAYNIPKRDCGSYSSGGAASGDAYKTWIRQFAAGIGSRRAIVIVEPDALASFDCLPSTERGPRMDLIADAVNVLAGQPKVSTYVDIGHSKWLPSDQAAGRLWRAGVAKARGFSLNVSNFQWTTDEVAYGKDVSARLGGKGFVIDTARNGQGPAPDNEWCNPAGRGLGNSPAVAPGTGPDAYLWIKPPGESDGPCNGGPAAGVWWGQYALGLAQRSAL